MKIINFIQNSEDKINDLSLEVIKASQDLAKDTNGTVTSVVFNSNIAQQISKFDLSEI